MPIARQLLTLTKLILRSDHDSPPHLAPTRRKCDALINKRDTAYSLTSPYSAVLIS